MEKLRIFNTFNLIRIRILYVYQKEIQWPDYAPLDKKRTEVLYSIILSCDTTL